MVKAKETEYDDEGNVIVNGGLKKKHRRTLKRKQILITPPDNFDAEKTTIMVNGEKVSNLMVADVIVPQTASEKRAKKRLYRTSYMSKPEVKARVEKRKHDPKLLAEKKEYSSRPEVKERKKMLSWQNRMVGRVFKQEYPELRERILAKVVNDLLLKASNPEEMVTENLGESFYDLC